MSEDDVKQIKVGNHPTGIIGLKNVIEEVVKDFAEKQDTKSKIKEWLSEFV